MHPFATVHVLAAGAASRNPGLGHYVRYGAILLAAVLSIVVWMLHVWRTAPEPEERWRRVREELGADDRSEMGR
jgi:hypothetical protein